MRPSNLVKIRVVLALAAAALASPVSLGAQTAAADRFPAAFMRRPRVRFRLATRRRRPTRMWRASTGCSGRDPPAGRQAGPVAGGDLGPRRRRGPHQSGDQHGRMEPGNRPGRLSQHRRRPQTQRRSIPPAALHRARSVTDRLRRIPAAHWDRPRIFPPLSMSSSG